MEGSELATSEVVAAPTGSAFDIRIEHVTQKFGRKLVLDDITLNIQGGELVALLGGSGSGKSTLVNIILGELTPTKGKVSFSGSYGFVPQRNLVHEHLRVRQHLSYYASVVKRLRLGERRKRINAVLDALDLRHAKRTMLSRCSGGETRRVNVGCELLADPDLLVLDEPTSGLDPGDSGDMIELLQRLVDSRDMTALVISHDYENIGLFDKVIFLAKHKICFYGTPAKLFEWFGTDSSREIYRQLRESADTYIQRFETWCSQNPGVTGGMV